MGVLALLHPAPLRPCCPLTSSSSPRPTAAACGAARPFAAAAAAVRSNRARAGCRTRVAQQLGEVITDAVPGSSSPTAAEQQLQQEQQLAAAVEEIPVEVPPEALTEFGHELEEDLASVAVTLTAVTGVIIFWRGVWSLLDYFLGDSIFGDVCCILLGLTIVLGIRLSGIRVSSSLWPPS